MKKVVLRISLIILLLSFGTISCTKEQDQGPKTDLGKDRDKGAITAPEQDQDKGGIADLEKGWQNLDIPLLEKVVKTCEAMIQKNPKDNMAPYYGAKAHFALADCLDIKSDKEYDQTGEGEKHIDAALKLIKASLSAKEDYVDTHILKYQILRRKMFHVSFPGLMMYLSDRRAAWNRAKELAPNNIDVQIMNALESAEGVWPPPPPEKAVVDFEKLAQNNPKLAEAYYHMGVIWQNAKNTELAKKNYNKVLEINPNHHWTKKKLQSLDKKPGA